jgi:hypothetical protein
LFQLTSNSEDNKKGTSTTKYNIEELRSKDIVIITYDRIGIKGILIRVEMNDFQAKKKKTGHVISTVKGHYSLTLISWDIGFLDEAHRIVNSKPGISETAKMFKAKAKSFDDRYPTVERVP